MFIENVDKYIDVLLKDQNSHFAVPMKTNRESCRPRSTRENIHSLNKHSKFSKKTNLEKRKKIFFYLVKSRELLLGSRKNNLNNILIYFIQ